MTLGNLRANGVRSLDVCCWRCHHLAMREPWPDDVPVPSFGCSCSARLANALVFEPARPVEPPIIAGRLSSA
jgi:hypothetical protein